MHKILIIVVVILFLFSCGNDKGVVKEKETEVQNTIISEQAIEFKEINELLKNDINNPTLYLKRARLYKKYNDLSSAVNDLDRAIKVDSLQPEFYLLKAELLKQQDKLKESKETLDQCMFIDNHNIKARIELGWLALIARNYKQALDYADAVLKMDVHNAETYYLKGMIFEDKGDTALAISSYTTAVEQENDYYDAYIHLGLLRMKEPNSLAKEYLKNALRIEPKSIEALYGFGMACQVRGDYNEAIETYHKMLEIERFREPLFNLGYIHQVHLKVYDVAIDYYTQAVELEPKYIDAYYNRALCYEELGNLKKAQVDLRHALKLSPQYTNAALALERVLK